MNLENPKYWKLLVNQSFLRYFLLKTLSEKEIHGYGLVSALNLASKGLCKPSQGTLYPALKELEKNNYAEGKWKKIKNRKRKMYKLTEKGQRALRTATSVLQDVIESFSPIKVEIKKSPLQRLPIQLK